MADEISKTTIVVLLILTILISAIGTLTIVNTIGNMESTPVKTGSGAKSGTSTISFTVEPQSKIPTGQAVVKFNIEK